MPTGRVRTLSLRVTINGHRKLFHAVRNVIIATARSAPDGPVAAR